MPNRKPANSPRVTRRRFLRHAGAAAAAAALFDRYAAAQSSGSSPSSQPARSIALVRDPADTVANSPPALWAADALLQSWRSRGVATRIINRLGDAREGMPESCIVVASTQNALARQMLAEAHAELPGVPESLGFATSGLPLLATAHDARGLVYALTELTERVTYAADPFDTLHLPTPVLERPANRIRSIMRMFVSDVEDKSWFHDRDFWPRYFAMLAAERFNRFNLGLSLGYDAPQHLRDTYFYFPYPFLLKVPGYNVRALGLPDDERDKNLQSLIFIGQQAAAHGLDFQLGLWTHAFQWIDSPNANYVIDGLNPGIQSAYCRDALSMLLAACPTITGLTFRTHGESGVAEGSYDFWKTLFSAVTSAGRPINIDLHAKGITQEMIDIALAATPRVTVSPKFWAEHMGLPYLQASIREAEMPHKPAANSFFSLSNGERSFLRYSYGDLFRTDRKYGILHRVWPGTQRLLLWGDPAFAAAYGRIFNQCGADGVEYFDPLSFKGRKGSGLPDDGDRTGYADPALRPATGDWQKYLYTYRLLGRLSYNPDADPETWRRTLRQDLGPAAAPMESALASASRILPLITSAHDPSAANANFWPEVYTNMSLFDATHYGSYGDTPRPRVFGNVSSLDPQLFASAAECADAMLDGRSLAKYTPMVVATQLEQWSTASQKNWQAARDPFPNRQFAAFRRCDADITIAAMLGTFFAWKLRAAVAFEIFNRTGYGLARTCTSAAYGVAPTAWAAVCNAADVYGPDLTFGPDPQLRGHWRDRLAAIDNDIAGIPTTSAGKRDEKVAAAVIQLWIDQAKAAAISPPTPAQHTPPRSFKPGQPLTLTLTIPRQSAAAVRLWHRPMNQAERYHWQVMEGKTDQLSATIPAENTLTPFPIQYYFVAQNHANQASLYPGLGPDMLQTPYHILEPA